MWKRTLSGLFITALFLLMPLKGQAQEPITLEFLSIRIWPEFDQPNALVFWIGQVTEETQVPVDLQFQLPEGAEVNAVAYLNPETNDLLLASSSREGNMLKFTSPNGTFHIELYDPNLNINGAVRDYTLLVPSQYDINILAFEIQHPAGSSDISIVPGGGAEVVGEYDLATTQVVLDSLTAGEQVAIELRYQKSTNALTIEQVQTETTLPESQPDPAPELSSSGNNNVLIILATATALLMIGGLTYWYTTSRSPDNYASAGKSRPRSSGGKQFCPHCGKPIQSGDKFCRHCGHSL